MLIPVCEKHFLIMHRFLFFAILPFIFSSCSSLKELNAYAEKSTTGIAQYNDLTFTFTSACQRKCLNRSYTNSEFQIRPKCVCKEAALADKNLKRILSALQTYFKQLALVSENKLADISLSAVEQPLTADKYFKKSTLKPYSNLLTNIINNTTNNYRARKLKKLISNSNTTVDTLLTISANVIKNNLLPVVNSFKSELSQVYVDLFNSKSVTHYEKYQIKKEFSSEQNKLENASNSLKKYIRTLEKIRAGFLELDKNKHRLKKDDARKLIQSYAEALDEIISEK